MPYNNEWIPVVILLDASGSTKNIEQLLNKKMRELIAHLKSHTLSNRISLMAAHYDDQYYLRTHFSPLTETSSNVLNLQSPRGATNTGGAITTALDSLDNQLSVWDRQGIRYGCPIFLLLTDGAVSPGVDSSWTPEKRTAMMQRYQDAYHDAASRIRRMVSGSKLIFGAVGIAHSAIHGANMTELSQLTDRRDSLFNPKVRYNSELDLGAVLQWMMSAVTRSAAEAAQRPDPNYSSRNHSYGYNAEPDPGSSSRSRSYGYNDRPDPAFTSRTTQPSDLNVDEVICVFFDLNRSTL